MALESWPTRHSYSHQVSIFLASVVRVQILWSVHACAYTYTALVIADTRQAPKQCSSCVFSTSRISCACVFGASSRPSCHGTAPLTHTNTLTKSQSKTHAFALTLPLSLSQVVPFQQRVTIFRRLVDAERTREAPLGAFGMGESLRVRVRRSRLFEDSFEALGGLGAKLRRRIQV
jgi:hypothetical protein